MRVRLSLFVNCDFTGALWRTGSLSSQLPAEAGGLRNSSEEAAIDNETKLSRQPVSELH